MSEFRQDVISGQGVIIAPDRAGRPDDFAPATQARSPGLCPFCAGHEHLTPAPLLELPAGNDSAAGKWRVRVVPNIYPAAVLPPASDGATAAVAELSDPAAAELSDSAAAAVGSHEVIIESPEHRLSTTDLSDAELSDVLGVYRERLLALKQDPRLVSGIVFKNMGLGGGATLEHVHSQLIALAAVPSRLRAELSGAAEWRRRHGGCAYCDMLDRELSSGVRWVAATESFAAFCPWASRMPYETWILPREHESHFEQLSAAAAGELATLLRRVIGAIEQACGTQAYNYVIHSAPFDTLPGDHYHWHIEVIPRITRVAGFELGSGWYINPVGPEAAAQRLRDICRGGEGKAKFC